jgi:hypothetical protein
MKQELHRVGFAMQAQIPVSFFRIDALKRAIPAGVLAAMDSVLQRSGWLISPSIFTKNQAIGSQVQQVTLDNSAIFACPQSGDDLRREGDFLINPAGIRWQIRDGIYDFKDPV